jgi:soluble lytic murein transglycosylase
MRPSWNPTLFLILSLMAPAAQADSPAALTAALAAVAREDWSDALASADGEIGRAIVDWHRLRAGDGTLDDYAAFLSAHADWPGLPRLRQMGEAQLAKADPAQVLAYFAQAEPATAAGALALMRAHAATGAPGRAEAEAFRAWTELPFDAAEQAAITGLYGPILVIGHELRLDRLLWDGEGGDTVERMLRLVSSDWQAVARARMALRDDAANASALVDAVPPSLADDPGLSFERFAWRMRKDRTDDALAMILDRSTSAERLGNPAAWADRRASFARGLLRDGRAAEAYRVASSHFLTEGADYADLEFLAGFIALRRLDDPQTALAHFRRLEAAVTTPISLSRALYWQGRALEATGDPAAASAFGAAARHQTAYYGLLAAERLDLSLSPELLATTTPADWRGAGFAASSVFGAARLLRQAGDETLAKRFALHLAEGLDAGGLAALAAWAEEAGDPHIALLIAKQAAERGVILPAAYFPIPAMVPDGLPVSRALALAVARRESEFNPAVVSPAGAMGLMQVMPGTARMMAETTGLAFSPGRLTADPAYNVAKGAAYLRVLIDEFGPSVALVAAGYNAGPGRPRRWIEQQGDPRDPDTDIVDWVEMIPFTETRTYVMRVAESVVIYRARLKGEAGPVRISAELRG